VANKENTVANTTLGTFKRLFKMLKWYESGGGEEAQVLPNYTKRTGDERIYAVITAEPSSGVYDCTEVGKKVGDPELDTFTTSRVFDDTTIQVREASGATGVAVDTIVELFLMRAPDNTFQWFFIQAGTGGGGGGSQRAYVRVNTVIDSQLYIGDVVTQADKSTPVIEDVYIRAVEVQSGNVASAWTGPADVVALTFPAWTAIAYKDSSDVSHSGSNWIANADTTGADVPGVSAKWDVQSGTVNGYYIDPLVAR